MPRNRPLFVIGLMAAVAVVLTSCSKGAASPTPVTSPPATTAAPGLTLTLTPAGSPGGTSAPSAGLSTPQTTEVGPIDVASPLLTLAILEGSSEYRPVGTSSWIRAVQGTVLGPGDDVRTLRASSSVVRFADGSRVKLDPSTQLTVEVFELLAGGPPDGQRVARVRVIDGSVTFDVAKAPTPPNIWEFVTRDGVIAIHGTKGFLASRESDETLELNLLDGDAVIAQVGNNADTGQPEVNLVSIEAGVALVLPSKAGALTGPDRDALLAIGEVLAIGGGPAVQSVLDNGDVATGLAIARAAFADGVGAGGVLALLQREGSPLAIGGGAPGDITPRTTEVSVPFLTSAAAATYQDGNALQQVTTTPGSALSSSLSTSVSQVKLPAATSTRPQDIAGLANKFAAEFLPPEPQNLYDDKGTLVGRKDPDVVVYDATGNPVGKRVGDLTALSEDGSPAPGATVPSVFYVEDPFGGKQLVASTFVDLVPKVDTGKGNLGLQEVWVPNLVTFGADGKLAPTFVEYGDDGRAKGTAALSGTTRDASGGVMPPPKNQYLTFDPTGNVTGQAAMPFTLVDDQGVIQEFQIPPPVVYETGGAPVGMQTPFSIVVDGQGKPAGLQVGSIAPKEFFQGSASFQPGQQVGVGAALPPQTLVVFDSGGKQITQDEFRPAKVVRNTDGDVVGKQIATALTCSNSSCFDAASVKPETVALLSGKVQVMGQGEDGKPAVVELQGVTLHDDQGKLVGFVTPQTMLVDPKTGGFSSFASGKAEVFGLAPAPTTGAPAPVFLFDSKGGAAGTFQAPPLPIPPPLNPQGPSNPPSAGNPQPTFPGAPPPTADPGKVIFTFAPADGAGYLAPTVVFQQNAATGTFFAPGAPVKLPDPTSLANIDTGPAFGKPVTVTATLDPAFFANIQEKQGARAEQFEQGFQESVQKNMPVPPVGPAPTPGPGGPVPPPLGPSSTFGPVPTQPPGGLFPTPGPGPGAFPTVSPGAPGPKPGEVPTVVPGATPTLSTQGPNAQPTVGPGGLGPTP
ncbi:MAG: FecR domain-containing protein, partial [Chloroflexi bacterium]|nr:FecR domain-containing protein [Chloroflexota bacterium]